MHLYQASLGGHESGKEAQRARGPTSFLGQNGGPRAKKNDPTPFYPPDMYLLLC